MQELEGDEAGDREYHVQRAGERSPADLEQRLQHERDDGGLEAHQHASHRGQLAMRGVDPGQHEQQHDRRQHEGQPGDQAATHTVQLPADVDGELHRLGTGQQHAEVERPRELRLVHPAAALDQLAMHDCDLPGGAAEGDQPELDPEPCGVREGRATVGR